MNPVGHDLVVCLLRLLCRPCHFDRTLRDRVGLLLKEQSDLAPRRLQIYANIVSRYMRQTYGQRSFPDVFFLALWGLGLYAYKQRKWLQALTLHCNTFIK